MKKASILVILALLFTAMTACSLFKPESEFEFDYFEGFEGKDGYVVTLYRGVGPEITIPSEHKGKPVVGILGWWYSDDKDFENALGVSTVFIPDSVSYFLSFSFFNLYPNLTQINVCENNEHYTSVDGVMFNKDMTRIISYPAARYGDYVIPDSVIEMQQGALEDKQKLTGLTLPSGLTPSFGSSWINDEFVTDKEKPVYSNYFRGCISLKSIQVSEDNPYFSVTDGVLLSKDGKVVVAYPPALEGDTYTIRGDNREVCFGAFYGAKNLKRIYVDTDRIDWVGNENGRIPLHIEVIFKDSNTPQATSAPQATEPPGPPSAILP